MNKREFCEAIVGKSMHYSRHCLATLTLDEEFEVAPSDVVHTKNTASVRIKSIHVYDDDCTFRFDRGVYVAVVPTGAGHLWVDRFEPLSTYKGLATRTRNASDVSA